MVLISLGGSDGAGVGRFAGDLSSVHQVYSHMGMFRSVPTTSRFSHQPYVKVWGPTNASYFSSFSVPISFEIIIIQNKNISQVISGFNLLHKMSKRAKVTAGKEWFNLVTDFL